MGVNLTPIIEKEVLKLDDLRSRSFAVDGNNTLYQFLALIRQPDGQPLTSHSGKVTSHLVGLLYRTTRLIADYDLSLTFVFDGKPPARKRRELDARRAVREKSALEYAEAIERKDYAAAWSKAVTSSKLTQEMIGDAKRLLSLLGIPWIQAPGEGEAQAAHMCDRGDVWAVASRDYDTLLYGSPRLLRYLTIAGKEFLPSSGTSRPLEPELITLQRLLQSLGIGRRQLVDIAILVGTDYNRGVKGIGPKRALDLIRRHGDLEEVSEEVRRKLPEDLEEIRGLFLQPDIAREYTLGTPELDREGVIDFLCGELNFSGGRTTQALQRLERRRTHPSLDQFEDG